jgi:hypothetical protein
MPAHDVFTAAALILVFLATPLVFLASLVFQNRNRRTPTYSHSPTSHGSNLSTAAQSHDPNYPPPEARS